MERGSWARSEPFKWLVRTRSFKPLEGRRRADACTVACFDENRWRKGLPPAQALREAQLSMLRGDFGRGTLTRKTDDSKSDRLPPYYWAAFVLGTDRPSYPRKAGMKTTTRSAPTLRTSPLTTSRSPSPCWIPCFDRSLRGTARSPCKRIPLLAGEGGRWPRECRRYGCLPVVPPARAPGRAAPHLSRSRHLLPREKNTLTLRDGARGSEERRPRRSR